jgi:ATP-dependent helicase/nuclease subunit A
MKFTPHQERALDLDRHLALTANAGSGKTQVLVERYVRALLKGIPASELVALTYTDKAAGALRRKIAERISDEIISAREWKDIARLESVRDALPSGFIGTIHSFCARVLREYPVEAGIDAEFSILGSVDGTVVLRECMTAVLGEVLRGVSRAVPEERLMDLLRSLGRHRLLQLLSGFVARPDVLETLGGAGGIYARPEEQILDTWETVLSRSVERILDSPDFLADLVALTGAAKPDRMEETLETLSRVRAGNGLAARAAAFLHLASMIFTKSGGIQKRFLAASAEAEQLSAAAERIAGSRRYIDPLLASLASGTLRKENRSLLRDVRALLSIAQAVLALYARRKEEDAKLDFDDLQLKMRLLLSNPSVRAELAGRFRFVMVDEFQDTNALQFDIILPLLQHLASGNLVIVGDPKQSIYRFRDADVEVFERSRTVIASSAGEGSLLPLGESFRPLRDIIAFVNLLFGGIMGLEGSIQYDPLVRARPNDDPGGVEILLPLPADQGGLPQEELVARRILDLVSSGAVAYTREEGPHPVHFRDIALLLRSRSGLEEFEQAFIRDGVPYVVSGGAGYFQTQDVYDMYNYLRFLLDTSDDIALAGILRSPFFTVSDAELFELARSRGERTLWEALADRGGEGQESLAHAAATISLDIALGSRLPAAELIARIISRTGFTAALAGTARGAQAGANMGKLLEIARRYESQGFTSLHDFVGRLDRLIAEEDKEGQAAIESHADALRIMTVHAAKGLEFPVVIVADLQRQFQFDTEPFLDPELGIGLEGSRETPAAPLSHFLKEQARRKAIEEEQRIFYVACTRARDRLLLSTADGMRSHSWLGWLDGWCRDHGLSLGDGPLRFEAVTPFYDGSAVTGQPHPLVIPVIRSLPLPPAGVGLRPLQSLPGRIDISPLPSGSKGEIFSASRIRTYVECPAQYFFRYVLGVPSGGGPFVPDAFEEFSDADYPAELRGRVFHAVMEHADGLEGPAAVESAVRAALAREAPFTAIVYPSLVPDVASLVGGVIGSGAWKEIFAGSEVHTEFSVSAALGGDFITGTLDRLYRGEDGLWTVLDYKTDSVSEAQLPLRAGAYWPQLDFYAIMVRRLCNASSVRTRLLFAQHPDVELEKILTLDDLIREEEFVLQVISRIRAGDFPPSNPPCRSCPMQPGRCSSV